MTLSLYAMTVLLMRGPLHRVEVDALFVHFPQRAHLAQLADAFPDDPDRPIDVFLGREAPEGEADGAVRELVVAAERAQHVRRLEARGRAGRARGHRELLHAHDERLALDEVEARVQIMRDAVLEVAIHVHL